MSTARKLGDGTQIIPLLDITEARCRCGRRLTWKATDESEGDAYVNYAECKCGMSYYAGQAEIKVEGIDNTLN